MGRAQPNAPPRKPATHPLSRRAATRYMMPMYHQGDAMKIGVIQTGNVRAGLSAQFGEYPAMFDALLNRGEGPGFHVEAYPVVDGAALPSPAAADGWLITGSRHGVYDDLPWIAETKAFLRAARAAKRPIVGVCFGHQILAEAFGGSAIKHPGGWRLGVETYRVVNRPAWMADAPEALRLHSLHQDQVVAIPADAQVWATSPGCAYAGLSYGDPDAPDAVSIQPHPEYAIPFARALYDHLLAQGRLPADLGAAALESVGQQVDNARLGRWFADYLRGKAASRAAA